MVGYYRLREAGVRLHSGAYIVRAAEFVAVEETTRIVEAGEQRVAEIIAEAHRVYAAEKARGYEEGWRDAQLEAVKRLCAEQDALDAALACVERDLARLVEGCVRKLIHSFDDAARAEAVVRQALAKMRREKRVELRAPPDVYGFFRESIERIRADYPEVELVDVVEDDSLKPGQIVVETSIGRVDANFAERIDELTRVLLRVPRPAAPADDADEVEDERAEIAGDRDA